MTPINTVILAGDSKKGLVQEGLENKSLLSIHGKPMVEYVADALRSSSLIGNISISGPEDLLKARLGTKVDYYVGDKGTLFENIKAGVKPFDNDKLVLVVTSDIPMVSGDMITDFIRRSLEKEGDFCYPIINKKQNEEQFPGVERTYVRLKEGTFTGGNVFLLNPAVIQTCEEFAIKLLQFRKQPWKTARLLGFRFLLGLLLGTLSIKQVEERFGELLQIKAAAIKVDYPEIGNDVDKPSDVEMVMRYLATIPGDTAK